MLALLAQATEDATNSINLDTTNSAVATGVVGGLVVFWIIFMVIAFVLGIFSLWMFIDALIRKDDDFATGSKVK